MTGKIKFYNLEKGFGFIKSESGQELFFHVRDLQSGQSLESLEEGAAVIYEEKISHKDPCATNVTKGHRFFYQLCTIK